jgi:hypothetical protein
MSFKDEQVWYLTPVCSLVVELLEQWEGLNSLEIWTNIEAPHAEVSESILMGLENGGIEIRAKRGNDGPYYFLTSNYKDIIRVMDDDTVFRINKEALEIL